ncbi:alpha/beta hydrolase family protein [Deinococcus malanensis]|uniref:alpha/beta hydrolase family protein n=1 Tax=Deinococcus malanensis TaxID=1706855 RepID=UPI00362CC731
MTATTQDTPATHVVAVSAPTDLRRVYETASLNILRRYYDAVLTPEQWQDGSPLTHAHTLKVPALLVVGTEDQVCPREEGRSFAAASGARLLEIGGMAHEPREPDWSAIVQETLAWARLS